MLIDFFYENVIIFVEKFIELVFGDIERKVVYGNSGVEVNEVVMKFVKYGIGRK